MSALTILLVQSFKINFAIHMKMVKSSNLCSSISSYLFIVMLYGWSAYLFFAFIKCSVSKDYETILEVLLSDLAQLDLSLRVVEKTTSMKNL